MSNKAAIGLLKTGVALGAGSQLVGDSGLSNMAVALPIMGTTVGAGMALKGLEKLGKRRR